LKIRRTRAEGTRAYLEDAVLLRLCTEVFGLSKAVAERLYKTSEPRRKRRAGLACVRVSFEDQAHEGGGDAGVP
jgi:hypothetical protein